MAECDSAGLGPRPAGSSCQPSTWLTLPRDLGRSEELEAKPLSPMSPLTVSKKPVLVKTPSYGLKSSRCKYCSDSPAQKEKKMRLKGGEEIYILIDECRIKPESSFSELGFADSIFCPGKNCKEISPETRIRDSRCDMLHYEPIRTSNKPRGSEGLPSAVFPPVSCPQSCRAVSRVKSASSSQRS